MLPLLINRIVCHHLKQISTNNDSILLLGVKQFLNDIEQKTDADYIKLFTEIKDMIKGNESYMRNILGESFNFFNSMQIIEVNSNVSDDKIHAYLSGLMMELKNKNDKKNLQLSNVIITPETCMNGIMKQILAEEEFPADRSAHIDQVGTLYESIKACIGDLFCDLVPSPNCKVPVNPRISEIYDKITMLRNLACIANK